MKASDKHLEYEEKKHRLTQSLKSQKSQPRWSLSKTTSNLFRPRLSKKAEANLDITAFNKVISVDPEHLVATVEGLTTYEDFVNETLKYACLPAITPELKTITVGGAIAGCGLESSSFRYGLVHETITEMEVLLSNGEVITCSPDNAHKDLFFAIPNTFGSLGYVLKAKVALVPAKDFVNIVHLHCSDPEVFFREMKKACLEQTADFIDGVIFDKNEMVLTLGTFSDSATSVSDYTQKQIYYLSLKDKERDDLTVKGYIWRWDPDWFWCSNVFFMQNPVLRSLFGRWMLHSKSYSKIMHFFYRHPLLNALIKPFSKRKETIIQDTAIPIDNALGFLDFFQEEIGIKPVWVCPAKCLRTHDFCPMKKGELYVDFGFWDGVKSDKEPGHYNRKIEKKVSALKGFKSLYSSSYYTEKEFWEIYNKTRYLQLKAIYDPDHKLRDFYKKCTEK